jgi:hypothetical protein
MINKHSTPSPVGKANVLLERLSNPNKPTIHRFFDTSPISPSGLYCALFELPSDTSMPKFGDYGKVVVTEIKTRKVVWVGKTAAWDTQLGAQVQWGKSDSELLFNQMDIENWEPFGVIVDIFNDLIFKLSGSIYMASPNKSIAATPCLKRISRVQGGYGVIVPTSQIPINSGFCSNDGVKIVSLKTGRSHLLISHSEINERLPNLFSRFSNRKGGLYTFHTKFNPQGTRLMVVLRWVDENSQPGVTDSCLITMDVSGDNLYVAVDFDMWKGGHHPNWLADGVSIVMNQRDHSKTESLLKIKRFVAKVIKKIKIFKKIGIRYFPDGDRLVFACFDFMGQNFKILAPGCLGSGHPSMDLNQEFLLTDAYLREEVAYPDNSVPLRLISVSSYHEIELVRVPVRPKFIGKRNVFRIDPHPVFCMDDTAIIFNFSDSGVRQVMMCKEFFLND